MDLWVSGINIRAFQGAAGQHGFLGVIESNISELFPIADQVSFHDDFMKCQSTLITT